MGVVTEAMKGVFPGATEEGRLTKMIESQTARLPSTLYLAGALGAIGVSIGLMASGRKSAANFVGQWAPVFLILGLYNKVVKQQGH